MRQAGTLAFCDFAPEIANFRGEVWAGLSRPKKRIPGQFLYDAVGAALFEQITRTPEYYPTRAELGLLEAHGDDFAAIAGPNAQVVEFGCNNLNKIRLLLSSLMWPSAYVPVDMARDPLIGEATSIAADFPNLDVTAICADFGRSFNLPRAKARRIGFMPGCAIGNFSRLEATNFLARCRTTLKADDASGGLLIGVDMPKGRAVLEAAYDDAGGVTAEFTLNLLARINRELGGDFVAGRFRHVAVYNQAQMRIEISLESLIDQDVTVSGRCFHFAAGERVHIEDSCKYAPDDFQNMARAAGFTPQRVWVDDENLFSLHWLEA